MAPRKQRKRGRNTGMSKRTYKVNRIISLNCSGNKFTFTTKWADGSVTDEPLRCFPGGVNHYSIQEFIKKNPCCKQLLLKNQILRRTRANNVISRYVQSNVPARVLQKPFVPVGPPADKKETKEERLQRHASNNSAYCDFTMAQVSVVTIPEPRGPHCSICDE